jgi:deazaflavin-dependent oxidoreductase (nitroreductase family)
VPALQDPWVAPALADGSLGYLEVTARGSGRSRRVHLGFARLAAGTLVVGAAHPTSRWQHDLLAHPECRFEIQGEVSSYRAHELGGTEREAAEALLVARYAANAPRHRLFLLRPVPESA